MGVVMADSQALSTLRETLGAFLRQSFGDVPVDRDGDFVVRRDGVVTWARAIAVPQDQTAVVVWSVSNVGMRVDAALTRFLATEGMKLSFGQFELNEETPSVRVAHALLGDYLSREEVQVVVEAVASASSHYGPVIKERFGGRLHSEGPSPQETALFAQFPDFMAQSPGQSGVLNPALPLPAAGRAARNRRVQFAFGILALVSAILASIYVYDRFASWALVVYVFLVTSFLIGRGVADVITDQQKVRRAVYFAVFPVVGTGVLYVTYRWWSTWWLSVVLASVVGVLVTGLIHLRWFPRIHAEELEDTVQRSRRSPSGN